MPPRNLSGFLILYRMWKCSGNAFIFANFSNYCRNNGTQSILLPTWPHECLRQTHIESLFLFKSEANFTLRPILSHSFNSLCRYSFAKIDRVQHRHNDEDTHTNEKSVSAHWRLCLWPSWERFIHDVSPIQFAVKTTNHVCQNEIYLPFRWHRNCSCIHTYADAYTERICVFYAYK